MTHEQGRVLVRRGTRRTPRLVAAGAVAALVAGSLAAGAVSAAADDGWSYTSAAIATNSSTSYEIALDPVTRTVYLTDSTAREEARSNGVATVTKEATGKVVSYDAASRALLHDYDHTGLQRLDGSGTDRDPLDWSSVSSTAPSNTSSSISWGSYGIAVDPNTPGGATIVTTAARQSVPGNWYGGGVLVYSANSDGPTEADKVDVTFDDGTPVFAGVRRVAVNTVTHKAYVTNLGSAAGSGPDAGFIAQIDLVSKEVEARITIPGGAGALGVTVDEANNLIYVGGYGAGNLYVIDGDAVDTSNVRDLSLNNGAIRALAVSLPGNDRPLYDAVTKRVYVSSYGAGRITVVDADPASPDYGRGVTNFSAPSTNSVAVDAQRGRLYSANLGQQNVTVYDLATFEKVLTIPTSGNAVKIAVDQASGDVWVSNFYPTQSVDVLSVTGTGSGAGEEPGGPGEPGEPGEGEPAEGEVAYPDGFGGHAYVPAEWTEGQPLTVRGTGWFRQDGVTPSAIAVKVNSGGIRLLDDPYGYLGADAVYGYVDANADGSWSIELPYPGEGVVNAPAQAGQQLTLTFLTGALGAGDRIRSVATTTTIVSTQEPGGPGEPGEPVEGPTSADISVSFDVPAAAGGLTISVGNAEVSLGTAALSSALDAFVASGTLPAVTVTDTRASGAGWTVSGIASSFVNGQGDELPGARLGWTPRVVSTSDGQVAAPGDVSTDLSGGSTLVSSQAGASRGTAVAEADLSFTVPTNAPAGGYTGTITLTVS
ncbi:WxL domain-containing protein [Microbacterium sp. No. 7]|uniref:WxL domain-containing protein n=1 Tax=Microbacterium sp. No. 7 TaxID=1714373 RepID=UPI0006D0CFEA|nr:WxL domain-containing protein [Microbacterium sp. No. 7]ALJ21653.1 hypothetical protein AOA12_17850 [Microbacterium sp. No. 7]